MLISVDEIFRAHFLGNLPRAEVAHDPELAAVKTDRPENDVGRNAVEPAGAPGNGQDSNRAVKEREK